MKITSITQTPNHHPALGPEFEITMNTGLVFRMWAEWFWDLDTKWDSNPENRLEIKLDMDWINEHKN